MASFSNDVKAEICRCITDSDKRYACLYAIVLYSRNVSGDNISVNTESKFFFELACQLLRKNFGKNVLYKTEELFKKLE